MRQQASQDPELQRRLGETLRTVEGKGPVRIAVIGCRGVGKSTWVNSVRRLPPKHPLAAPVGADEVYTNSQRSAEGARYLHAGMVLQDVPGAEGSMVTAEMGKEYIERFMLHTADACIFMYTSVIGDRLLACASMLEEEHGVPVFLVRNKVGQDCRNDVEDGNAASLYQAFQAIKERARQQIAKKAECSHLASHECLFLIEARYADAMADPTEEFQKDFHRLKKALQTNIRDEAKRAQLRAIFRADARELAEARAQLCRSSVSSYAICALMVGALPIPVPGVTAVGLLGIAHRACEGFMQNFCLTPELIGHQPELREAAKKLQKTLLGLTAANVAVLGGADVARSVLWYLPILGTLVSMGVSAVGGHTAMEMFCDKLIAKLQAFAEKIYRVTLDQEIELSNLAQTMETALAAMQMDQA